MRIIIFYCALLADTPSKWGNWCCHLLSKTVTKWGSNDTSFQITDISLGRVHEMFCFHSHVMMVPNRLRPQTKWFWVLVHLEFRLLDLDIIKLYKVNRDAERCCLASSSVHLWPICLLHRQIFHNFLKCPPPSSPTLFLSVYSIYVRYLSFSPFFFSFSPLFDLVLLLTHAYVINR